MTGRKESHQRFWETHWQKLLETPSSDLSTTTLNSGITIHAFTLYVHTNLQTPYILPVQFVVYFHRFASKGAPCCVTSTFKCLISYISEYFYQFMKLPPQKSDLKAAFPSRPPSVTKPKPRKNDPPVTTLTYQEPCNKGPDLCSPARLFSWQSSSPCTFPLHLWIGTLEVPF